jgi:hypothetical protein
MHRQTLVLSHIIPQILERYNMIFKPQTARSRCDSMGHSSAESRDILVPIKIIQPDLFTRITPASLC